MTASQDPYRFFRIEAAELSEELSRGVLSLEGKASSESLSKLLRAAHTLKGAARVVKHRAIAERSHELEELVSRLRDRGGAPERREFEAMLAVADSISDQVHGLTVAPAEVEKGAVSSHRPEELPHSAVEASELDALSEAVSEAGVRLSLLRQSAAAIERARRLSALLLQRMASTAEVGESERRAHTIAARSIAVELVEVTEKVERTVSGGLDQTEREIAQVQRAAERLRLVSVASLRAPLERTARDVGSELGKRVTVSLSGGDVRVDAHMLAQVRSALVQAVRNAVAHGIEAPGERVAKGKAKEGSVDVRVARRGSRVAFQCRDDGKGVDLGAVRAAAERAGLLPPGAGELDEKALVGLLMKGGLTTARAVTEASGRGIGLDVIRETAERLGGEASLRSEPGGGATLELVVPIVLSSIDALLVETSGVVAAIPLDAVSGAARVSGDELVWTSSGESVVVGDRVLPFRPLSRVLARESPRDRRATWPAVIVRGSTSTAALGVDRLLGTDSIVVRGLPPLALTEPVVLGASLDVDGIPQLVLDPAALVHAALRETDGLPEAPAEKRPPILVVDDSLTTRMLEQSILESAGYDVELAASAEEALDKITERPYALYLVDVEMPGMDGFDFVAKTRAVSGAVVPAILVSSRSAPADLERGRAAGASAYVVKGDFDQQKLLDTIRGLVG